MKAKQQKSFDDEIKQVNKYLQNNDYNQLRELIGREYNYKRFDAIRSCLKGKPKQHRDYTHYLLNLCLNDDRAYSDSTQLGAVGRFDSPSLLAQTNKYIEKIKNDGPYDVIRPLVEDQAAFYMQHPALSVIHLIDILYNRGYRDLSSYEEGWNEIGHHLTESIRELPSNFVPDVITGLKKLGLYEASDAFSDHYSLIKDGDIKNYHKFNGGTHFVSGHVCTGQYHTHSHLPNWADTLSLDTLIKSHNLKGKDRYRTDPNDILLLKAAVKVGQEQDMCAIIDRLDDPQSIALKTELGDCLEANVDLARTLLTLNHNWLNQNDGTYPFLGRAIAKNGELALLKAYFHYNNPPPEKLIFSALSENQNEVMEYLYQKTNWEPTPKALGRAVVHGCPKWVETFLGDGVDPNDIQDNSRRLKMPGPDRYNGQKQLSLRGAALVDQYRRKNTTDGNTNKIYNMLVKNGAVFQDSDQALYYWAMKRDRQKAKTDTSPNLLPKIHREQVPLPDKINDTLANRLTRIENRSNTIPNRLQSQKTAQKI